MSDLRVIVRPESILPHPMSMCTGPGSGEIEYRGKYICMRMHTYIHI